MEQEVAYFSQAGMEQKMQESLRFFREDLKGTVADRVPLYFHDCDFERKTLTTVLEPTPWMADRTGAMSNGAFSVALDQTMGILCLYVVHKPMTPTVTMQMSLLRPIPLDRKLYIKTKLLGTDGTKIDVAATAWSEGMKDDPACSAVGVYFNPSK
jgi:predicted transcriptional regulator